MNTLKGFRKWSMGVLGLLLVFVAALMGKLSPELATVVGAIVGGYYTANGYTTGRGGEPRASKAGSVSDNG